MCSLATRVQDVFKRSGVGIRSYGSEGKGRKSEVGIDKVEQRRQDKKEYKKSKEEK